MENNSGQAAAAPKYKIAPLNPAAMAQQWVTLVTCGTMLEADFLRSRLQSDGVEVFIPDENLMTAVAYGLNAYGYIRIQVKPEDYETARELMVSSGDVKAA